MQVVTEIDQVVPQQSRSAFRRISAKQKLPSVISDIGAVYYHFQDQIQASKTRACAYVEPF